MEERQMDLAQSQSERAIEAAIAAVRAPRLTAEALDPWCVECGEDIPDERRLAMPATRHCVRCAGGIELKRRRR